jgi:2-oxoglutarate dehydrogenase E2 component (dihydrolipoamide succinyltransferase)
LGSGVIRIEDAFFRRAGVKLTYMPAITESCGEALAAYPQVNVSVEGYNILFKETYQCRYCRFF